MWVLLQNENNVVFLLYNSYKYNVWWWLWWCRWLWELTVFSAWSCSFLVEGKKLNKQKYDILLCEVNKFIILYYNDFIFHAFFSTHFRKIFHRIFLKMFFLFLLQDSIYYLSRIHNIISFFVGVLFSVLGHRERETVKTRTDSVKIHK